MLTGNQRRSLDRGGVSVLFVRFNSYLGSHNIRSFLSVHREHRPSGKYGDLCKVTQ